MFIMQIHSNFGSAPVLDEPHADRSNPQMVLNPSWLSSHFCWVDSSDVDPLSCARSAIRARKYTDLSLDGCKGRCTGKGTMFPSKYKINDNIYIELNRYIHIYICSKYIGRSNFPIRKSLASLQVVAPCRGWEATCAGGALLRRSCDGSLRSAPTSQGQWVSKFDPTIGFSQQPKIF